MCKRIFSADFSYCVSPQLTFFEGNPKKSVKNQSLPELFHLLLPQRSLNDANLVVLPPHHHLLPLPGVSTHLLLHSFSTLFHLTDAKGGEFTVTRILTTFRLNCLRQK